MNAIVADRRNANGARRNAVSVRPYILGILWFIAFVAAYYFAYRYGMSFSQSAASPFWFPDLILLCALLSTRPRYWVFFILATIPIRLFSEYTDGLPVSYLLAVLAIDSVKGVVAAAILQRVVANPLRPQSTRDFVTFAAVAVFGIPFLSAFAGAAVRTAMGHPFWPAWEQWFLGDVLAQLVVTPFILYWVFNAPLRNWSPTRWRVVEACCVFAGLLLTGYLAANTPAGSTYFAETRFYAPIPFLFWAAIRFAMPGAAAAVAIVSILAVEAAIGGRGPFAGHSRSEVVFALQNYLFLRSAPLYVVAILHQQMHAAQLSLRESEARFRRMAHSAPVLIWMASSDKCATFFNQGWLEFTGRSIEQERGSGWTEGLHPEDFKYCLDRYLSAFDAKQPFELEYRLRRYDGEYRWILDKGVPRFAENGEFAGYVGSAVDITDKKRAEEANRELAHTQRLAAMGELTASIAHELRQSLSAIALNAQAAENLVNSSTTSSGDLREMVSDIRASVMRADSVISRIRDFLRKRKAQMQAVDLNTVVTDVLLLVSGDALRRGIRMDVAYAPGLPSVLGDKTQLQQVLLNLVVNAMDAESHLPEADRRLAIRTHLLDDRNVEVTVSDCGCGIPEDQLPLLFDTFFTTRSDGMGLGLSIARTIVTAHRGQIWAENNAQGGATFHFTVPLAWRATEPQELSLTA